MANTMIIVLLLLSIILSLSFCIVSTCRLFSNAFKTPNDGVHSSELKLDDGPHTRKNTSSTTASDRRNTKSVGSSRPPCFHNSTLNGPTCRYDDIGKHLEDSAKFAIIHPPSDAIPAHRRIPTTEGSNLTYIAERRSKGPSDGSLTALVEYNPTFLPLTDDLDPTLLNYLTGRYHKGFSDEEADRAKYLSISRSGNLHSCGGSMRRLNNPTRECSYLSLSLVDAYLQPIAGASAAVRLSQAFLPRFCYKKFQIEPFQDFQIIAVRSTKQNVKKDQLFVITSDSSSHVFPIDIRRVPSPTNDASDWNTKIKGKPVAMEENLQFYGRGLQVRLMEDNNAPGTRRLCASILNSNVMHWKKNYHIFDAQKRGTFMEIRPHGNRELRKVNFYAERFHKIGDWELVPNGTMNYRGRRNESDVISSNAGLEDTWKYTGHAKWKGGLASRGTSCCIDLEWGAKGQENKKMVKVGISHAVSKERGYVSRFYAFETQSPKLKNVAVSGPFCLGRMTATDVNAEMQIFPHVDHTSNITIEGESFDCPHITFASGLVEYQADSNFAILSYGVNDCYSRSIVVSKDTIRTLLGIN